ncbi:uncharacterized protein PG986_011366 [Apiospora aurea]|uniref:Uncharacterized protein n=1 Tax=Apiospora aurea TaxID=335848 RepID=A0ABR1Q4Y2_9PEZI
MERLGKETLVAASSPMSSSAVEDVREKKSMHRRVRELVWDSLDRSPEERRFISKIDFYILTWAGLAYFSKNLNQNNVEPRPANAYVSGMKEELNVVGNEYQTFTTMWTISRLSSYAPEVIEARLLIPTKADVPTQVRISIWCPSWELLWVLVTFATAAVHTSHHLYAFRFFLEIASQEEEQLALDRMKRAGKQLDEPFTLAGLRRILGKWHFWVYTAYYTFFICSENIGTYMNLWLKSLNRYTIPQINNFPTATNAITIVTTLT